MLPTIYIDTMSLSQEFDLTQQDVDKLKETVVQTVTKVIETCWREQAKKELGSTRNQYLNSIIVSQEDRFTNLITLVGSLPNMIESGASPFDLKEGFERSNKKTITKNDDGELGWYLTIPFSYAQPGSLGESGAFTGVLPSDIAKALKTKQKEDPEASLRLSDIPDEFRVPTKRESITLGSGVVKPDYQHKSNIYEGISQPTKGGPVMSFRRVSNNSDDDSWIHSGIKAHNLAEKALKDAKVPEVVVDIIDSFLDQII